MEARFIFGVVLMSLPILLLPLSFFQAQEISVFLDLYKRLCTIALIYRSKSNHVKDLLARDSINRWIFIRQDVIDALTM